MLILISYHQNRFFDANFLSLYQTKNTTPRFFTRGVDGNYTAENNFNLLFFILLFA